MHTHPTTGSRASLTYIAPVFRVADLSRSLAFYRDRLGFVVDFIYETSYASVVRDGCYIHLKRAPAIPRDHEAFAREEHLDACIAVENAEVLSRTFASAGVPFLIPVREVPYGTEFYVRDPDGYVLAFVQPASGDAAPKQSNQTKQPDSLSS